MAFRLQPEESVAQGLRRLARKELRSARVELKRTSPPGANAIHTARKRIKKVRAILEFIEGDNGSGLGDCRKQLRDLSRTLSDLRDADAMVTTLTKLRSRNPRLLNEHAFARVRRQLTAHRQKAMEAAERDGAWKKVDRLLRELRRHAKRWRPVHSGSGALTRGIRVTHGLGRKALARARKRQCATDFHEWRKATKTLWYALRLIEPSGRAVQQDVRALHRTQTWLGDDHNLAVLCTELAKDASICGGPVDFDRLRLAAHRYQCELRKKAIARAKRIYERKSGAYARGMKRAWKAWQQRHAVAGHTQTRRRQAA